MEQRSEKFKEAERLCGAGDLEAGAARYREYVSLEPGDPKGHLNLACVLSQLNQLDEAEKEFRALVDLTPGEPGGYAGLGVVAWQRGRKDEAIAFYKQAIAMPSPNVNAFRQLAELLLDRGRDSELSDILRTLGGPPEQQRAIRTAIAHAYARARRSSDAMRLYRAVLEEEPGRVEARYWLAAALKNGGQPGAALSECSKILEQHPNHVDTLQLSARLLLEYPGPGERQRAAAQAAALYRCAERQAPDSPRIMMGLVRAEWTAGNRSAAERLAEDQLRRHPERGEVALALAGRQIRSGRVGGFLRSLGMVWSSLVVRFKNVQANPRGGGLPPRLPTDPKAPAPSSMESGRT